MRLILEEDKHMNLYEIDNQIMDAFEQAVDPDTGEIINSSAYDALNELQLEFDRKAEGILLWIKNLSAETEALKQEKQAFEARQKAAENKAESLKKYISTVLNGQKFSTPRVSVTWRKSESAEYDGDVLTLPVECVRMKAPEVNKAELKKLLKSGAIIKGASLVTRQNIQIK